MITQEFATQLTFISAEINRIVGVLVSRKGKVETVTVGDAHRVYLPDIGRQRGGSRRFRGLRLVRSHVEAGEVLSRDDLADLSKLRLDAVVSIVAAPGGYPGRVEWAHLVPDNPTGSLWETYTAAAPSLVEVDFTTFITELEAEFQRKAATARNTTLDKAMIAYVDLPGARDASREIAELHELAKTAGISVTDVVQQRRSRPDPKFIVGRGKLEEIVLRALQLDVELIIFGCDLAPRQLRAITDATDLRVIDRTQLILDIFAQHATTRDGKLQVELAQLKYALPRLVAHNTGMSRLTGGIGGRGPGETKLEVNRRRARDRIQSLKKSIKKVADQRQNRRRRRTVSGVPVISIVGYTNAGKSTLLNALTRAKVLSADKLFATLAPATRRLRFPEEREVVLTDTVGFIHDLPKDLVAAFQATLEELGEADLLVHLVDISAEGYEGRIEAVEKILADLGLGERRRLLVFNKIDRLEGVEARALAKSLGAIPISSLSTETTRPLVEAIEREIFFAGRSASFDALERAATGS